jgi:hypothetical protein
MPPALRRGFLTFPSLSTFPFFHGLPVAPFLLTQLVKGQASLFGFILQYFTGTQC